MLERLELINYRRFAEHRIDFSGHTLLAGANNAGKSSIIEALRLVAAVTGRVRGLQVVPAPEWLLEPAAPRGVMPSLRGLGLDLGRHTFHGYASTEPASIRAMFANGSTVTVWVGLDERDEIEIFGVVRDHRGNTAISRRDILAANLPDLAVQPRVGPVLRVEATLHDRTILNALRATPGPTHFRNQLVVLKNRLPALREAAAATWPGLEVRDIEHGPDGLSLWVRTEGFVGELASHGDGLQMWLQMLWFLVRSEGHDIVVLDEPDVYMHPDLQLRLIRYLQQREHQAIVATHSVEMLGEVDPEDIVHIDTERPASVCKQSAAEVQSVVDQLGAVHSVHLNRMVRSGRACFVEGDDFALLRRADRALRPSAIDGAGGVATLDTGGWGGWQGAKANARMLSKLCGRPVDVFAIFDRDYRWDDELNARRADAAKCGIDLHIWSGKELENHLLVPDAISRLIASRSADTPTADDIWSFLVTAADGLRDRVLGGFMDEMPAELRRGLSPSTVMRRGQEALDARWAEQQHGPHVASGKDLFGLLSSWSQEHFGTSVSPAGVVRHLRPDDACAELAATVARITSRQALAVPRIASASRH